MHTIERKVEIPNNHLALPNIRKLTILLTSRGEFEVHSTNLWGLGKKYNVIQSCLYVYIYPAIMWNTKEQMKLCHFEGNPVVQGNWSNFFNAFFFFCQISKWICPRYTCVPHPEPSSLLPPHTIPLGRPSALASSIQYCVSNLDWQLVSYMIFYMFQCHSPKSSHPLPLPQSP